MRNIVSSSPARDRAGGPGTPATLLIVLILILRELLPLADLSVHSSAHGTDWFQNNLIKLKVQIYLPALATTGLKEQKPDGFILFRNLIFRLINHGSLDTNIYDTNIQQNFLTELTR